MGANVITITSEDQWAAEVAKAKEAGKVVRCDWRVEGGMESARRAVGAASRGPGLSALLHQRDKLSVVCPPSGTR